MDDNASSFTFQKREFLHKQLDDILRLWYRASGQGTFFFSVSEGNPNFQYGIQLDFDEDLPEPDHHSNHHQPQHSAVRRRGPARQARDRARAARFQAAQASAAAKSKNSSTADSAVSDSS